MKPIRLRPGRLTELARRRLRRSTREAGSSRKSRVGLAAVVAGCVALMSVVVLTGAGNPNTGLKFTQSGHFVYNSVVGKVFHLDGATREVDAQGVELPGGTPGAQVVQTDKGGFVLSRSRIDQFGKSDLTVADPIEAPAANEQPVGLEAAGAAFAVYKDSGRVVRLGDKQTVAFPGGKLGDPVVTSDGTLWVHRTDQGDLCQLALTADRMSCPASVPKGHRGGLTAVGEGAVFVDLTAGQVYSLKGDGIDNRTDLSLGDNDVPDDALVAGNDVRGRVAIVDPEHNVVHLVDISHRDKPQAPISQKITPGHYDRVASSGDGLALLDRKNAALVTLDADGRQIDEKKIPSQADGGKDKPEPNLYRGDDSRVYVESGTGDRVIVVDRGGKADVVDVGNGKPGQGKTTVKPTTTPPPGKTPKPPVTPERPVTHKPAQPPTHQPEQPNKPGNGEKSTPPEHKPNPGKKTTPPRQDPTRTTPPRKTTPPTTPPAKKPTNQPTAKPGKPGAPVGVQARVIDGGATVTWKAAAAHGATVSSYKVSWTGGSTTVTGLSASVPNLKTKTGYYFTVSAVNSVGTGPAVRSNRIELKWAPAESPRELLVRTDGTSGSIGLEWDQPTFGDGTFLRYEVSINSRTAPPSKTTTGLTATISGLVDGRKYTYYVRAITRASDGQEVVGKYASLSAASIGHDVATTRIVASRGAGTSYDKCPPGDCAFIQVRLENLKPNTAYSVKPYTEDWGNFNGGYTGTTSNKGQLLIPDQFPCSAVGQLTWVTVTGPEGTYTSNKFFWKADD
ncbi:fibronectin type III domain-containing protein [Kribbella sp. NPDC051952]|uniref:fibronectin type III domain-containing protein n=1 Tax=Kribbella sp. NPDC051952 TaxID=3154851 RepID=UPI003440A197